MFFHSYYNSVLFGTEPINIVLIQKINEHISRRKKDTCDGSSGFEDFGDVLGEEAS
jgi:hypothetical protein